MINQHSKSSNYIRLQSYVKSLHLYLHTRTVTLPKFYHSLSIQRLSKNQIFEKDKVATYSINNTYYILRLASLITNHTVGFFVVLKFLHYSTLPGNSYLSGKKNMVQPWCHFTNPWLTTVDYHGQTQVQPWLNQGAISQTYG